MTMPIIDKLKCNIILIYILRIRKTIKNLVSIVSNVPWAQKLLLALVGLDTVTMW